MLRLLACLLIAVPAAAAPIAAPRVEGAWVRAPAVPGRPAAGYLTITGTGQPDRLVGVTSPGLRIELHTMSMDAGVMKMTRIDAVPVPAGASVALATGGNHLMIFGLAGAPKAVPLTLVFGSGAMVNTVAEVRAPAAGPPPADPHAGHAGH